MSGFPIIALNTLIGVLRKRSIMKTKEILLSIKDSIVLFFMNFIKGNLWTKLSYFIMGTSCFRYKQLVRGFLFLFIQLCFIVFMVPTPQEGNEQDTSSGIYWISTLDNLGDMTQHEEWNETDQIYQVIKGDNSLLCLLFGTASIIICIAMFFMYVLNIKNAVKNQELAKTGGKINSLKDDISELMDEKFHITILTGPVITVSVFTIIPLVFMVLMAFTNYNRINQPPGNLFTWVGFENFINLFGGNSVQTNTFVTLFVWTIIWAW